MIHPSQVPARPPSGMVADSELNDKIRNVNALHSACLKMSVLSVSGILVYKLI